VTDGHTEALGNVVPPLTVTGGNADSDAGGRVVATGTPEEVAAVKESYTGQFLRELLPKESGRRAARAR